MSHRVVTTLIATLVWAAPALSQDPAKAAQNKLLSQRAASADAYRKLAETVKGLQITSDTYVKDFVAESDMIRASMDDFIRGVRLGQPTWFEDGTCEVPAEVTVAKIIEEVKRIHEKYYKGKCGKCIKTKDIEEIKTYVKKDIIRVVGNGAPREDLPPGLPEGVAEELAGPSAPAPVIPELWKRVKPNERLAAKRAAEVDARRKLLERILGIRITSDTIVKDFVTESDVIRTTAAGTLVGARDKSVYYHSDDLIVEVTVEVPVESVITTIKALYSKTQQGDRVKATEVEEITKTIQTKTFEATGMGCPRPQAIAAVNAQLPAADRIPQWAQMPIRMSGNGVPPEDKVGTPQGKLMAARAAELDAKRKLGEHIQGLQISSDTSVKDFVTEHDEIQTQMDAILVGSTVEDTKFDADSTATVTVSMPGMQLWEIVYERIRMKRVR